MKRIIIGADSAGYTLKEHLKAHLKTAGYEVTDMGTDSEDSCHYPIFADKVCKGVVEDIDNSFGILVCGTGIGMSMCANKHKGIRAALCSDTFSARMTRLHNDANVLCIGARVIGPSLAEDITDAFLNPKNAFEGGRHKIRVDMMMDFENE
jgi:ribose 5-phosphate isomerase B